MRIVKTRHFQEQLREILRFIALDSPTAARRFKVELNRRADSLKEFPYRYRRSIYFDDAIRDLIFKGYVIPYIVDQEKREIIILGIVKYRDEI